MVKSTTAKKNKIGIVTASIIRKKFADRKCAYKQCGQTFTPTRKSQIYHHADCGDKARQERYWIKWRAAVKRLRADVKKVKREDTGYDS